MSDEVREVVVNQDVKAGELVTEEKIATKIVGEHRVFFYMCRRCNHKRQSYKKTIAREGICRVCRRAKVPENQMSLFERIFGPRKQS